MEDAENGHGNDDPPEPETHAWLRRLPPAFYRGLASVHWEMTLNERQEGWLGHPLHWRFREVLLHTLARYRLICPAYCLMPDHLHLLWMGVSKNSDQRRAVKFFREHLNPVLSWSQADATPAKATL